MGDSMGEKSPNLVTLNQYLCKWLHRHRKIMQKVTLAEAVVSAKQLAEKSDIRMLSKLF
jgi:hypothetical protein